MKTIEVEKAVDEAAASLKMTLEQRFDIYKGHMTMLLSIDGVRKEVK